MAGAAAAEEAPAGRPRWALLGPRFEDLAASFGLEHLSPDPLEVVREYADPRDVEVAGILAAGLAFGSARVAVRNARALLSRLGAPPAEAARSWAHARDRARVEGWRHRWLGAGEASAALDVLGRVLREHGSLEAFFAAGDPGPTDAHDPIGAALASFAARALALAPRGSPPRVAYFFAGPASQGAAKRLCLFLRWMCRRDRLDLGAWSSVPTARLVVPLDTHVARIARYTGLLRRRSADWRAALELTASLRRLDPDDPVRFDYALCRLGVLGTCPKRHHARKCGECPLFEGCLL